MLGRLRRALNAAVSCGQPASSFFQSYARAHASNESHGTSGKSRRSAARSAE
jgi:hypothetical protein